MATIVLCGYSSTRSMTKYMRVLFPADNIWDPVPDGGIPLWGFSSDFETVVVPLINALVPEPILCWIAVGGAWDMRRSPNPDSPFDISVAAYGTSMAAGLNSILTNTTIPYLVVANCVPIDRTDDSQGNPPAPYRFEVDAELFRAELANVIATIGNARIISYDYNQTTIDSGVNQWDGIHRDIPGNLTMSILLADDLRLIMGMGGGPLGSKWDGTGAELVIAPHAWGEGNGKANQTAGNFPTLGGYHQPAVMTNFVNPYGYRYEAGNSHLRFDNAAPTDSVIPTYSQLFTNTNEFTIEFQGIVSNLGTQRYICGHVAGADYWFFRVDTADKIRFLINFGGVVEDTKSLVPVVGEGFTTITARKVGATFSLFLDGVEVTAYSVQDAYNRGNVQLAGNMEVGNHNGLGAWPGEYYWFCIYNRALSDAEILSNHNLGLGLGGMAGRGVGGSMSLSYPGSGNGSDLIGNGIKLRDEDSADCDHPEGFRLIHETHPIGAHIDGESFVPTDFLTPRGRWDVGALANG